MKDSFLLDFFKSWIGFVIFWLIVILLHEFGIV